MPSMSPRYTADNCKGKHLCEAKRMCGVFHGGSTRLHSASLTAVFEFFGEVAEMTTKLHAVILLGGLTFLATSAFGQQSPGAIPHKTAAAETGESTKSAQDLHPPRHADLSSIQHIVFIVKENRTFDNYFGTFPGADGATTGTLSTGQVIPLGHQPDLSFPWDINHGWGSAQEGIDGGRMDHFDLNEGANVNGNLLAYTQLTQADIPNYFIYAKKFVLADAMFSSMSSSSFSNHLYIVAAQDNNALDISLPNAQKSNPGWGCDSPAGFNALLMDPEGNLSKQLPCWDFRTLADSLQNAGVSWGFYAPPAGIPGYNFSTLDAISHIRYSPLWTSNVFPDTQFITDAQNGKLPAVSWLATGVGSEH